MKILYISNYPLSGSQSPSINERDFVATLLKKHQQNVHLHLIEGDVDVRVPKEQVTFFSQVPTLSRPFHFLLHAFKWAFSVRKLAETIGADVVVVRFHQTPLKELILCKLLSKKVFVKSIGQYWISMPNGYLQKTFSILHKKICESFFKSCAGVEAVTDGFKTILLKQKIDPKKSFTIANSVHLERFNLSGKANSQKAKKDMQKPFPVIGFAGAKPEYRGGKEVIELVRKLQTDYPNIKGVIAGDSNGLEGLKELAKDLEVDDRMSFLGWVEFDQLPFVVSTFDIGLSFAPDISSAGGNSSMKIRQYLASGVIPITEFGSNEFIATENLGSIIPEIELSCIAKEVRNWIGILEKDSENTHNRLFEYAKNNLSTEHTLAAREKYWSQLSNLNS